MIAILLITFIVFLCWGSFLNVLAYRLIQGQSLMGRSCCPYCHKALAWYDLIPVVSWIALRGTCRTCARPISILYPTIELLTAALACAIVYFIPADFVFAYLFFMSALIVNIHSDLESMLLARIVTIALAPIGLLCSIFGLLPIDWIQSISGMIVGFLFLWTIAYGFKRYTGNDGLGEGDLDLIVLIGSFVGSIGTWFTILFASLMGIVYAVSTHLFFNTPLYGQRMPFAPFLAAGALLFIFFGESIIDYFL